MVDITRIPSIVQCGCIHACMYTYTHVYACTQILLKFYIHTSLAMGGTTIKTVTEIPSEVSFCDMFVYSIAIYSSSDNAHTSYIYAYTLTYIYTYTSSHKI